MKDGDENVTLDSTNCEKDLGVHVDNLLEFTNHITEILKKARKISSMLIRNLTYKTKDIMVPVFKSLVRPHLEYSNVVWNPYKRKDIDKIEKVQRYQYIKSLT